MMILSNFILLAGLASPDPRTLVCTIAYSSYYAGCIEQHYGKGLDEQAIQKVLKECKAKAQGFTKALDVCKDAKFD
jgi:hypothetical protein